MWEDDSWEQWLPAHVLSVSGTGLAQRWTVVWVTRVGGLWVEVASEEDPEQTCTTEGLSRAELDYLPEFPVTRPTSAHLLFPAKPGSHWVLDHAP